MRFLSIGHAAPVFIPRLCASASSSMNRPRCCPDLSMRASVYATVGSAVSWLKRSVCSCRRKRRPPPKAGLLATLRRRVKRDTTQLFMVVRGREKKSEFATVYGMLSRKHGMVTRNKKNYVHSYFSVYSTLGEAKKSLVVVCSSLYGGESLLRSSCKETFRATPEATLTS